jgi:hypothetical protein
MLLPMVTPKNTKKMIFTWKAETCPPELMKLIEDQNNIDWVSFVPEFFEDVWLDWMEGGCSYRVKRYPVKSDTLALVYPGTLVVGYQS